MMKKNFDMFAQSSEEFDGLSCPIEAGDCIVMSLHPEPFELIMSGAKPFEFRKRWRKRSCIAFIYVSLPRKAIEGLAVLGTPIKDSAERIAEIAEHARPGNGPSVYEYFREQGFGLAIPILAWKRFSPIYLDELREKFSFSAPQFFSNVDVNSAFGEALFAAAGLDAPPWSNADFLVEMKRSGYSADV